jgi:hypothetical protein
VIEVKPSKLVTKGSEAPKAAKLVNCLLLISTVLRNITVRMKILVGSNLTVISHGTVFQPYLTGTDCSALCRWGRMSHIVNPPLDLVVTCLDDARAPRIEEDSICPSRNVIPSKSAVAADQEADA